MSQAATVLLIGGSGFLGRYVTSLLLERGDKVIIPTRSATISHHPIEVTWITDTELSQEHLNQWVSKLDSGGVVINLVGQLHDKPGFPYGPVFKEAHVELVKRLISAFNHSPARRFIHISSLGADSHGPSMYQRSKGDAERYIKESSLNWTILRPSVIFGSDDQFIQLFASLCNIFPVIPLASAQSRFQPVAVSDVAQAISQSIDQRNTFHQSIDLGGPSIYTLKELVELAGRTVNKKPLVIPMPHALGVIQAWAFEHLPGKTLMSRDNLASMQRDNVLPSQYQSLKELFNINPTALETLLP
ncbi:MAG: complex I NDUFA9 subunit family protein [Betaproteobacteria bacterium]|nr:complex I NDUFA9 subunit family protein [Betaproteobacteria bacterium]MDE2057118.1 complex I NDUFA9 subunit family protein [Betaproteobacteria bacterium]HQT82225.1 complex I NDUFA9 subunit family protein [Ferrovaceae bacterium]